MSDGDDLDIVEAFAEDDGERIAIKYGPARTAEVERADERADCQFAVRSAEFLVESKRSRFTPIPKIVESGFCFCLCLRV